MGFSTIKDEMHGGLLPPFSVWSKDVKLPKIMRMDLNADLLNIMFRDHFRPTMPQLKTEVKKELEILPKSYICIQPRPRIAVLPSNFPTRRTFLEKNIMIGLINLYLIVGINGNYQLL